jgi:hypothetical protein
MKFHVNQVVTTEDTPDYLYVVTRLKPSDNVAAVIKPLNRTFSVPVFYSSVHRYQEYYPDVNQLMQDYPELFI